jgi:hypothetical protein
MAVDTDVTVPSEDVMIATARAVFQQDPSVLPGEINRFSEEIVALLHRLRDGDEDLTVDVEGTLRGLYKAWEADGFPAPDDGWDEVHEGNPNADKPDQIEAKSEEV